MFRLVMIAALATALIPSRGLAHPHEGDEAAQSAPAAPPATGFVEEFIMGSRPTLDLNARIEFADQAGLDKSVAHTLRGRLGVLSGEYKGFQAFAEYEHTSALDRDSYRAASAYGPVTDTVIADPENDELNRVWLQYKGFDSVLKAGRQRIKLDNDRYIGNVGWRQNEQTYDAVRFTNASLPGVSFDYSWIYNVQRIFTEDATAPPHTDFDSRSHAINVSWKPTELFNLSAYSYLLDLTNDAGSAASSDTFGGRISGKIGFDNGSFEYWLEHARQEDSNESPLDYDAHYYHAKTALNFGPFGGGVGWEILSGGDGFDPMIPATANGVGFATPLATLHAFNGFADKFLATPGPGLEDRYAFASVKLPAGFVLSTWYHNFSAEDSSRDYGYEWDFALKKALPYGVTALAKAAFYQVDTDATGPTPLTDTQRLWFELTWSLPDITAKK